MKTKQILSLAILTLLLLSSMASVLAYFPDTHFYENKQSIATPINSELYKACADNPDVCYAGNILNDVSVIFYYTSFEKYAVTHSPAFCEQMLAQANGPIENACAVGACMHQPQDIGSHQQMVPYAIEHAFLPNGILHPPTEQHLDNIVNAQNPEIHQERLVATEQFEKCVPLFKRVMSDQDEYRGVNLDSIFDKFVVELQGEQTGYNPSFNNISSIPLLDLAIFVIVMLMFGTITLLIIFKRLRYKDRRTWVNWISVVIFAFLTIIMIFLFIANLGGQAFGAYQFLIKPVSNLVPLGGHTTQSGIDLTRNFLEQGISALYGTDASGGEQLANADASIRGLQYLFGFIILGLFIGLLYLNFRTPKNKRRSSGYNPNL